MGQRSWFAAGIGAAILGVAVASCGGSSRDAAASRDGSAGALAFSDSLPGAPLPPVELASRLAEAWRTRPAGYRPRTRHLRADGTPMYTNRLFLESSPYLKQHAHNPVNWYPWGDEAFETARRLHRPVLLSVGYSTCHWCHVMEEESFEDEEIARFLNQNYVAIKVDREERPDVDAVYMSAVQMLSGRGGWPMTVWLTPDRKPFFGGTYFPARDGDRGAGSGFLTILRQLREVYGQQPDRVAGAAAQITAGIQQMLAGSASSDSLPGVSAIEAALHAYATRFDPVNGGLQGAPKFPSSLPIRLLLRDYRRTGDAQTLAMARRTLDRMADGGIRDQVGGGFHRYSTDERWLVPHFEKMLYDNALLAMAYVEGFQATGDSSYARVARDIFRYLERDMTSPDGAFYSATDADSPGPDGRREEGRFFTWTPAEIEAAVGREGARLVRDHYGVTGAGNYEGRNILAVAADQPLSAQKRARLDALREALYAARARRPPPARDEKILASWNGLMISALARASLALGEPAYAARAARAADFVLGRMRRGDLLVRSIKDGQTSGPAFLDDYAFLIAGLIDLYEATGEPRWLREAIALDRVLARDFEDPAHGGYFLTGRSSETMLAREKPDNDGAEPSGNSVEAMNLLRLAELTTNDAYRVRAERAQRAFTKTIAASATALPELLLAVDFRLAVPREILIVVPHERAEAEPMLAKLRANYLPNRVITVAVEGADLARQTALVPLLEGKVAQGGRATAYVCERGVCELPTTDPAAFERQINPALARPGEGRKAIEARRAR
ncbi:MAG: thioredoxin domain-containing protein [Candidatus Eisenbacteria bacterium]